MAVHLHHLHLLLHVARGAVHAGVLAHHVLRDARVLAEVRRAIHHDTISHVHRNVHV